MRGKPLYTELNTGQYASAPASCMARPNFIAQYTSLPNSSRHASARKVT